MNSGVTSSDLLKGGLELFLKITKRTSNWIVNHSYTESVLRLTTSGVENLNLDWDSDRDGKNSVHRKRVDAFKKIQNQRSRYFIQIIIRFGVSHEHSWCTLLREFRKSDHGRHVNLNELGNYPSTTVNVKIWLEL